MNANRWYAKGNRFLPAEPDTAVLLRPVCLAAHTSLDACGIDNWLTQSGFTQRSWET